MNLGDSYTYIVTTPIQTGRKLPSEVGGVGVNLIVIKLERSVTLSAVRRMCSGNGTVFHVHINAPEDAEWLVRGFRMTTSIMINIVHDKHCKIHMTLCTYTRWINKNIVKYT